VSFTGSYTVDPTGRVTISGLTDTAIANMEFYLSGPKSGMITLDTSEQLGGYIFQQTGSAFSAGSFSGNYAFNVTGFGPPVVLSPIEFDAVGPITADGVGNLTGTVDNNILANLTSATPTSAVPVSGTFTANSDGVFTGTLTGLDLTNSANQDAFSYYLIDTTKGVVIETDPFQLTLGYFELQ
jgi:hypothetical protein